MRIALIYCHALREGGYPRDIRWLASALVSCGVHVTLVTESGSNTEGLDNDVALANLSDIRDLVDVADFNHVFSLFIPKHALVLRKLREAKKPVILSPMGQLMQHSMEVKKRKKTTYVRIISLWLKKVALHAFGPIERDSFRRYFPNHKAFQASLGVFPPSVDHDRRRMCKKHESLDLMFFGRNDIYHKGIDILLHGFSKAISNGTDAYLTIAGQPYTNSLEYIRAFLDKHKLQGRVRLVGKVHETTKWELLSEADYLVFLSRWDGPPRPIREAIVAGTPVIVTPETNMGHLVEAFNAGLKVDLECDAVALTFQRLGKDHESRRDFVKGVRRLKERLEWKRIAEDYVEGYKSILSGT